MTDSPLVSVIVRTKNRAPLLREALASLLAQTHSPLEILVVNDGGADVVDQLPPTTPGRALRYLDLQPGRGRSNAANAGLEAAGGEYLLFLDDDDRLDPPHLANLLAALNGRPDAVAAYSAVRVVDNDGRESAPPFADAWDPGRLLLENYIPIHALLFRRAAVTQGCRFDPAFDRLEDWDFWLQVHALGTFVFVPECTASYHVAEASGFGVKQDDERESNARIALYRKWLPRWNDAQLLTVMDRGRAWPRQAVLENEKTELRESLSVRERQLREQGDTLLEARELATRQALELQDYDRRLQQADAQVQQARGLVEALQAELALVYGSRSWKLTAPLRLFNRAVALYRAEGARALSARAWRKLNFRPPALPAMGSEQTMSQRWRPLSFPRVEQPLVSIVIPVYNKHLYTFHCLEAVLRSCEGLAYEVVVVDDRSSDETPAMLAAMDNLVVLTNEENSGFIRSCNAGARAARGEWLVLLNNDTEPKPGWLQALLKTFEDFPEAGLAGARLVYPDGTLQEAGGIVWQDGSAWNYGRNGDPNRPEYAYARPADYCSGAVLLLRRQFFLELGLFDEHYLPAYYEDTDLAFRVRAAGKQVIYQPMATVVHFEGVSSGTDTGSGMKRYQVVNQEKFFERWRETLASHRPPGQLPHLEKEREVGKRVLVLDARVLMPDHDSGSLRMVCLLKVFQGLGYKVSFLPDNLQYHERYTPGLQALGIECLYFPYLHSVEEHLRFHGHLYDLVLLSRVDVADAHLDAVKRNCPRAKVLFDTVDLHFLREQRQAELEGDKALREAAELRKHQELRLARKADLTLVVSPAEIELFRQAAPDVPLALLSNIHRVDATEKPFAERRDILFIANFEHPPNTDAMEWYLDEIHPLVQKAKPGLRIRIVGGHPPARLRSRASDTVEITGFVSDIRPLFNDIRLSVAPLRYGAGVKGKVNSSMAFGVPVVATSVGVEGMGLQHGRDVLVADDAQAFAQEILRAYDDETLWTALAEAGKRNIEEHFSFAVAERQLREVLERIER